LLTVASLFACSTSTPIALPEKAESTTIALVPPLTVSPACAE
jgi:hypothetical protein